jgi:hypothetical protein
VIQKQPFAILKAEKHMSKSGYSMLLCSWFLLFATVGTAQTGKFSWQTNADAEDDIPCFAIRVHFNEKPVPEPQVISFRARADHKAVSREGSCFRVPRALLKEKTLDVSFVLPKNKVYLSAIPAGFFLGVWDVDLQDSGPEDDVAQSNAAPRGENCARHVLHRGTRNGTSCRALPHSARGE